MRLTDRTVRNAKKTGKVYRLNDGGGLYAEVTVAGSKIWRFRYKLRGKENRTTLGYYPEMSLAEARVERDKLKLMLRQGQDPVATKRQQQAEGEALAASTFRAITEEYLERHAAKWADSTRETMIGRYEKLLFPWLGDRPITDITAPELLKVLQHTERRGRVFSAHKAKNLFSQVARYAIATGRADRDPSQDLKGALAPAAPKHHAAITDSKLLARFVRDVDALFTGSFTVKCALRLLPLLLLRPGEVRQLEWDEVDYGDATIRIPGEKMKKRRDHIVPLSRQAIDILTELEPLTGGGQYVFPAVQHGATLISKNTLVAAIRRLGYGPQIATAHGFRTTASTMLHEMGFNTDHIERQLAHADRNTVRGTYNRAEFLPERRKMMQQWADYLDSLKAEGKVVPIRQAAGE